MSITLFAQPYDITAKGFFFDSADTYAEVARSKVNRYGMPVEEFEIQVIDGAPLNLELAKAVGLHQGDIAAFFNAVEDWDDHQKRAVIVACAECGAYFDLANDDPDDLDIDLYEDMSLRDLAEHFVGEGLFGDIPERLAFYIDYEAIARDLSAEYAETWIAGTRFIYRAA